MDYSMKKFNLTVIITPFIREGCNCNITSKLQASNITVRLEFEAKGQYYKEIL